jgi:hypothetical protein
MELHTWHSHTYFRDAPHFIDQVSYYYFGGGCFGKRPHHEACTLGIHALILEGTLPHSLGNFYYFIEVVISWRAPCTWRRQVALCMHLA